VCQTHQPIGDRCHVFVEPSSRDNFNEEVNKERVHSDNHKEFDILFVIADIDPPVE
jgi:hypothetical protein